jgi:hypothetical protein
LIEPSPGDSVSTARPEKQAKKASVAAVETGGWITASVETLTLPKGLYLFSVRGGAAATPAGGLILPAMQIGAGPGAPAGSLEILSAPETSGAWLCRPGDKLVAKVVQAAAPVLLTSIRTPDMAPLLIAVENLDTRPDQAPSAPLTAVPPMPAAIEPSDTTEIPLRIMAHIQNKGDVPFIDEAWAGLAGQRLAVEGFSITPLKKIDASEVECKALTATRSETPWVNGGALCGSRGKGLPLVGFCIRVKPQPDGKRYDCEYSGTFASGKVVGPAKNGAPCWSTAQGDFLEALQVKITERV